MARSRARVAREDVPPVYALADVGVLGLAQVPEAVATLAEVGISWIQIRAKDLNDRSHHALIDLCTKQMTATREIKLWINDRTDLALLFPGTALHLGQQDLPPKVARRLLGEETWIGRSTHDLDQLREADADPAVDVIALGPIYSTESKENPEARVGLEVLRQARELTDKPLVAIGGIQTERVGEVLAAGADSIAMIGALCRGNLRENSLRLLEAVDQTKRR